MFRRLLESEKMQALHRAINSLAVGIVIILGINMLSPIYEELSGLKEQRVIKSELAQIVQDEGYKSKPYKDTRGLWTIGFGHLIKEGEKLEHLTPQEAVRLLHNDYMNATTSVDRMYPWATGDVRLVLINMTYQMGERGVSKFQKTIDYLRESEYVLAAGEMLDSAWAKQTPLRASRLAGRIMQLE